MNVDECGAPERIAQTKLMVVAHTQGKLTPADVTRWEAHRGDEHAVQPRVVSITQATELGTVYTVEETRAIADTAHELGMYLHVDGARLANAAVSLDASFREVTTDAGVDVVSFGGTKNGALAADAVIFLDPRLAGPRRLIQKQAMQLLSKSRFVAAQFVALLDGALWRTNAENANAMASRIAAAVAAVPGAGIALPVQTNAVFATLPPHDDPELARFGAGAAGWPRRFMAAFDTTEADVAAFARVLHAAFTS
jgi:threonine aldolase